MDHRSGPFHVIRSGSAILVYGLYLDPVSVVNINVDVENPGVILEQLQYGHHYVVDVAEATRLKLLQSKYKKFMSYGTTPTKKPADLLTGKMYFI